ncbi:MAG TPA: C-terminal binding protein, partial [Chloroflexota bacterium]|nr:C-terminal binding protein [Chloroflexota bacterium]
QLEDADIVVNRWGTFDQAIIRQLRRCRAVLQPGTGYDSIDDDAATEYGIVVINLPTQCLDEVANHAIAFVLALNRKLNEGHRHARSGQWRPGSLLPIGPLVGETFGLLGLGNIARETGRRAQAFGLRVIASDPFVSPRVAADLNIELTTMDDVLSRADYVSCHIPLNPRTFHILSEAQFRLMKPSAIFVNTARGRVVDENALIRALREGWIAAAGLDVLEQEPPRIDNPLLNMDNVIVTPHLAGTSNATPPRQRRQIIESLVAYLQDKRPAGLVNPIVWDEAQAKRHQIAGE